MNRFWWAEHIQSTVRAYTSIRDSVQCAVPKWISPTTDDGRPVRPVSWEMCLPYTLRGHHFLLLQEQWVGLLSAKNLWSLKESEKVRKILKSVIVAVAHPLMAPFWLTLAHVRVCELVPQYAWVKKPVNKRLDGTFTPQRATGMCLWMWMECEIVNRLNAIADLFHFCSSGANRIPMRRTWAICRSVQTTRNQWKIQSRLRGLSINERNNFVWRWTAAIKESAI